MISFDCMYLDSRTQTVLFWRKSKLNQHCWGSSFWNRNTSEAIFWTELSKLGWKHCNAQICQNNKILPMTMMNVLVGKSLHSCDNHVIGGWANWGSYLLDWSCSPLMTYCTCITSYLPLLHLFCAEDWTMAALKIISGILWNCFDGRIFTWSRANLIEASVAHIQR